MTFSLPELPYERNALEPYISENTVNFHYGKHHNTYVVNLNKLVEGTDMADKSLEEVIYMASGDSDKVAIFNNAAQVWNHTFYWNSMKKDGGGRPSGILASKIEEDFGSFDALCEELKSAAVSQFGSGWAWLVVNSAGKLEVTKTANADTPIVHNQTPLLTIDVWEHAYYLDFQNRRPDYVAIFLDKLVNWEFAEGNFAKSPNL